MVWRRFFIATIVVFSALPDAGAQSCGARDFRPVLGEPRDQGDTGWCFSHTTADLVTAKLKRRVSAFAIATDYILGDLEKLAASDDPAVREYLNAHPELLKDIRSARREEPANYRRKNILTSKGLYNTGGLEDGSLLLSSQKGFCDDHKLPSGADNYDRYLKDIALSFGRNSCPDPRPRAIGDIRGDASKIAAWHFSNWTEQRCDPRFKPETPLLPKTLYKAKDVKEFGKKYRDKAARDAAQAELWAEIDAAFDAGRPVAIGYNAYDISKLPKGENPRDGDHSSLIAARRMRNGVCEYFVRNSYGKDCDYVSPYQASCEADHGGTWVPRSALKTLYSVVSVP